MQSFPMQHGMVAQQRPLGPSSVRQGFRVKGTIGLSMLWSHTKCLSRKEGDPSLLSFSCTFGTSRNWLVPQLGEALAPRGLVISAQWVSTCSGLCAPGTLAVGAGS